MVPVYVVLLGPPGVGKGTQAEALSNDLGLPHVSSGDIFRTNLQNQTELGKKAQAFMNRGELVPDDLTIAMIQDRLEQPDASKGAILDGFPRTPAQALALEKILDEWGGKILAVPYISAPPNVLIERISGRWTCRAEGHVYHAIYNPPKKPGKCDIDGSELYQREDEKPETVTRRIQVYMEQTTPLIAFYRQRNLLAEIDGTLPIEQVTEQLLKVVKKD
ncbi:MAG: adenylate kinase [Chloroflexi bacterium]|nr:adenylate kinase [Chloroflexota bacterium]